MAKLFKHSHWKKKHTHMFWFGVKKINKKLFYSGTGYYCSAVIVLTGLLHSEYTHYRSHASN